MGLIPASSCMHLMWICMYLGQLKDTLLSVWTWWPRKYLFFFFPLLAIYRVGDPLYL